MKSFGNAVGRERGNGGSMVSMPRPKKKRIGRERDHGIETVTARETEVTVGIIHIVLSRAIDSPVVIGIGDTLGRAARLNI